MKFGMEETPSYEELSMRMELSGGVPIPKRTYDALFCGDSSRETLLGWISDGLSGGRFGRRLEDHRTYIEDFVGFCLENGYFVPERAVVGSLTIPDGVKRIWYSAFSECTRITSVTIPDSVTDIGSSAFRNCTGLTSVTMPDRMKYIGSCAFLGCERLRKVRVLGDAKKIKNMYGWPENVSVVGVG